MGPRVLLICWKDVQTVSSRGSKSRNKVSVGEPAEGSLPNSGRRVSLVGFCLETAREWLFASLVPSIGMCFLRFDVGCYDNDDNDGQTTPNNGSLGSQVDEERSKLREVRRIAGLQKPKCVERKWRLQHFACWRHGCLRVCKI